MDKSPAGWKGPLFITAAIPYMGNDGVQLRVLQAACEVFGFLGTGSFEFFFPSSLCHSVVLF